MQDVIHGWFDRQHEQAISQPVEFCLGMIHRGMLLPDGTQQPEIVAMVRIKNEDFARGYQLGREWFFNEAEPNEKMNMTDQAFVTRLQEFVDDEESLHPGYFQTGATDLVYWYIGCLLGELSGHIFPQREEEMSQRTIIVVTTQNTVVA